MKPFKYAYHVNEGTLKNFIFPSMTEKEEFGVCKKYVGIALSALTFLKEKFPNKLIEEDCDYNFAFCPLPNENWIVAINIFCGGAFFASPIDISELLDDKK